MPATPTPTPTPTAATPTTAAAPTRRLVLLPKDPLPAPEDAGPRRYRLARLESTPAARRRRFAHLQCSHD